MLTLYYDRISALRGWLMLPGRAQLACMMFPSALLVLGLAHIVVSNAWAEPEPASNIITIDWQHGVADANGEVVLWRGKRQRIALLSSQSDVCAGSFILGCL
jgi:hypothetical protein